MRLRKMLSDWEAPYIQELVRLIETQSKLTLVNWAVDYAEAALLPLFRKHALKNQNTLDARPEAALQAARDWLSGRIKLPQARKFILECHAAARENAASPIAQAAARAIGQSASTIHSARHCIGLALYGALAAAYDKAGVEASWEKLEHEAAIECGRMQDALRKIAVESEPDPANISWHC